MMGSFHPLRPCDWQISLQSIVVTHTTHWECYSYDHRRVWLYVSPFLLLSLCVSMEPFIFRHMNRLLYKAPNRAWYMPVIPTLGRLGHPVHTSLRSPTLRYRPVLLFRTGWSPNTLPALTPEFSWVCFGFFLGVWDCFILWNTNKSLQ